MYAHSGLADGTHTELLAAQVRGTNPLPRGNRDGRRAPQGCYPCAGDDRWIAISIETDSQWRALCDAAGIKDLASLGFEERLARHDGIDGGLSQWTRSGDPHGLMRTLQRAGVIAAVVADARVLVEDPQLSARGFWVELDHADVGLRRYPGNPIRLGDTPVTYRRSAPLLGEHNREVLSEWLDYPAERCEALEREAVLADRPPPPPA